MRAEILSEQATTKRNGCEGLLTFPDGLEESMSYHDLDDTTQRGSPGSQNFLLIS